MEGWSERVKVGRAVLSAPLEVAIVYYPLTLATYTISFIAPAGDSAPCYLVWAMLQYPIPPRLHPFLTPLSPAPSISGLTL
jgi:hypothetical protein